MGMVSKNLRRARTPSCFQIPIYTTGYTVHNLNISLLYLVHIGWTRRSYLMIWLKYIIIVKDSVVLWFKVVHILPLIACISTSLLTDPLEQQAVSFESIVCSMCYKMCIIPHDCNYIHWLYCVRSHYNLFVCLVMMVDKMDIISSGVSRIRARGGARNWILIASHANCVVTLTLERMCTRPQAWSQPWIWKIARNR